MSTITNSNSIQSQYSLARDVGWAFAREYYKYFHDNPEILHQFYGEQSRLIRGLEGEEVKICQGLQVTCLTCFPFSEFFQFFIIDRFRVCFFFKKKKVITRTYFTQSSLFLPPVTSLYLFL